METYYKKIFYAGIAYGECPVKGQKLKKTGLPIKKLDREFPYLLGESRGNRGKLQIFFSLLPEYRGKTLFGGKPKAWKPETAEKLIHQASERAFAYQGCTEQIIAASLNKDAVSIPLELWAACLYQQSPFDSICISPGQENGEQELWQLTELLTPYLARMKRLVFKGQRNQFSDMFEDYLYGEFGIVMSYAEKVPKDMLYFDFGQKCLNHTETLKFLDTTVKNGYNTEVNWDLI